MSSILSKLRSEFISSILKDFGPKSDKAYSDSGHLDIIFKSLAGESTCGWTHASFDICKTCDSKVGEVMIMLNEVINE